MRPDLKQLLQHEPGGEDALPILQATHQFAHLEYRRRDIAPESERLIWTGEKIDTIAPAITPLTKACKSLAQPHPFKYSPHSSKDFVVSGEADAEYEECAYEVSFQCPSGEKGDPHIIIRSATAQVLAREIQRKSDDVAKLAKILNDKLKEK